MISAPFCNEKIKLTKKNTTVAHCEPGLTWYVFLPPPPDDGVLLQHPATCWERKKNRTRRTRLATDNWGTGGTDTWVTGTCGGRGKWGWGTNGV